MNLFVTQTCHVMGPLATLVLLRTISLLIAAKRSWNHRSCILRYGEYTIYVGTNVRKLASRLESLDVALCLWYKAGPS